MVVSLIFYVEFTMTFNNSLDATGGKSIFFTYLFNTNNMFVYLRPNRDCNSMLQAFERSKRKKRENGRTSNKNMIFTVVFCFFIRFIFLTIRLCIQICNRKPSTLLKLSSKPSETKYITEESMFCFLTYYHFN